MRASYGEDDEDSFVLFLCRTQYDCINTIMTSYIELLDHYFTCIIDKTLQCIKDVTSNDYNHVSLQYFCGAIFSRETNFLKTVWTINSIANVKIYMEDFSMQHFQLNCKDEYVLLASKKEKTTNKWTDSYTFCGQRFPWQMTQPGSIIKVVFVKAAENSDGHFSLYYHTTDTKPTKYINVQVGSAADDIHVHHSDYSKLRHTIHNVDVNRTNHFHFYSYKHTSFIKLVWYIIADVVCYDGPGRNSPVIKQHFRADSSTYQLYCVIANTNPALYLDYSLYAFYDLFNFRENYGNFLVETLEVTQKRAVAKFSLSIDMNSHKGNVFYWLDVAKKQLFGAYLEKNKVKWSKAVFKLTISKLQGISDSMLINGQDCSYGGISLYQYLNDEYVEENYANAELKILHQCTHQNIKDFPIYLLDYNLFLLFIVYKGYTKGTVELEGHIAIELDHILIPNSYFNLNNKVDFKHIHYHSLNTTSEASIVSGKKIHIPLSYVLQPYHFSKNDDHDYLITFTMLIENYIYPFEEIMQRISATVFLAFVVQSLDSEKCVYCYVKSARSSDFIDFFEEIVEPSSSKETGKFIANIESIRIYQRACRNPFPWLLFIKTFDQYDTTLNACNISLMFHLLNNYLTIYRNVQLFDDYTWFVLRVFKNFNIKWKHIVTLHLTCLTTDVYVEHMIHVKGSNITSALYKWKNTSQSVWFSDLANINIILISERKKVKYTPSCTNKTRGIEQIHFKVNKPIYESVLENENVKEQRRLHGYGLR